MHYYNQISKGYRELHKEEQLDKIKIIEENIEIKPSDIMLDLGCGPYFGDFNCKVVGIDSSIELLKQAKIPKVLGKAEYLPFKNKVFDIVVSITSIQNFDDIEKSLNEAKRVGKESFVFTFLKKSDKANKIEKLIIKHFSVEKRVEEDKDIILITKYK